MAKNKSTDRVIKLKVSKLNELRLQLFQAAGIVATSRAALATTLEPLDEDSVADALTAAGKIIDGVASALFDGDDAKGGL